MKFTLLSKLFVLAMLPLAAAAQDSQTVRFGVDPSYAPLESKAQDGSLVGLDIDLGNAICAHLKAKCVWVEQSFDGMIPALEARKFDAILSAMAATAARRKQIDFSHKLYGGPSSMVARSGSKLLPTAQALQGQRVGVVQGSTQEAYARDEWQAKGVSVVSYQTQDLVYADLANARLDAAFQPSILADYGFLRTPRGKGFALAGPALNDKRIAGDGSAIGLRKGDAALEARINEAIDAIRKDGSYQKISAKYFDFDIYGE